MRTHLLLPILLSGGPLSAQTGVVSPAIFANAEATSQNRFPFGEYPVAVFRYLQVHDDLATGNPLVVRGLTVRRMGGTVLVIPDYIADYPAYSVTLSAWCSTAITSAAAPTGTFDTNHGTDRLQVINNQTVSYPASSVGPIPQPFTYRVPFSTPFSFRGTGSLCWEVQITGRTNTLPVYHDTASTADLLNPPIVFTPFGPGCKLSATAGTMALTTATTVTWASGMGRLTLSGFAGPANSVVVAALGLSLTSWAGLPLPYLVPGSQSAPSGPCYLLASATLVLSSPTDGSGRSTTTLTVPATRDLHGANVFAQLWAYDAAANPIGLVTSNGMSFGWTAPFANIPVGRVVLVGTLGPSGTASGGNGLVTRFDL